MVNLLYWPIVLASFYFGFEEYPLWWILVLGAAATVAFFITKPEYAAMAFRERGPSYVLFMIVGSSLPVGLFFFFGWIASYAFYNISN